MPSLKSVIENNHSKWGRIFDLTIQFLIVVSLVSFALETLPDNSEQINRLLFNIELFCVIIFTLEYLARILVADKPFKFIFSFFGIIDLLAILPFYLTIGFDLRSVRAFRFLRLFRGFKLIRYIRGVDRFQKAFNIVKEELIIFSFIIIILLFLSSVGIYYFENEAQPEKFSSVFSSLWWSVATLTTVGYGDVYPITDGGKFFTFFILLAGLGVVSIPAGLIASAFAIVRTEEDREKTKSDRKPAN